MRERDSEMKDELAVLHAEALGRSETAAHEVIAWLDRGLELYLLDSGGGSCGKAVEADVGQTDGLGIGGTAVVPRIDAEVELLAFVEGLHEIMAYVMSCWPL